ncbi:hypothetical protein [Mycoplasma miroungirhinis]|uniref:Lipoprotein n=1 Tax=Mycoplasma miroungirhinis TaxID=754516 RepID=A0A6M4JDJ6_9MOLU|nr:hypothetical protein [Mycoplasma miroungirhinis]QJR44395.1 hypothetical protein HLA92_03070 [Mycoplasma miroungirhinis]
MKTKTKKLLFFSVFSVALATNVALVSCAKAPSENNNMKQAGDNQKIQYKTKDIILDNNEESRYEKFISEINSISNLSQEYNKISIKIPQLFNLKLEKQFDRKDFEENVLPSINKADLSFNLELNDNDSSEFIVDGEMSLKEIEDFLEKQFNNYYVSQQFFLNDLAHAIENVKSKASKITEEKATKDGKSVEYKNVVTLIKNWLFDNSMIKISDNIKILEINQNKLPGWSLNLKVKVNDQTSKNIKLDFKKPNKDWDANKIKQENLTRGFIKKTKNKWNENIQKSKFAQKLEKIIQTLKVAIIIDDQKQITSKAAPFLWTNIISKYIASKTPFPKFILNKIGNKFIVPKLQKYISMLEEKLSK